jgi:hypothetical protein
MTEAVGAKLALPSTPKQWAAREGSRSYAAPSLPSTAGMVRSRI